MLQYRFSCRGVAHIFVYLRMPSSWAYGDSGVNGGNKQNPRNILEDSLYLRR